MFSATYSALFTAALEKVARADEFLSKEGATPFAIPRFASSRTKAMVDLLNEATGRAGGLEKELAAAKSSIADLEAGSKHRATMDWLNTTGGRVATGVGAAGLVGAPLAYGVGHAQGARNKRRQRNMAYGAGLATGLAAPGMFNAAAQRLQQQGYTMGANAPYGV